ncbi:MAG: hypothetical protein LUQ38_05635 [Methanotrichaceae archaeon]|nr:hypothetical protein [Methanotrichaceae archaeon]
MRSSYSTRVYCRHHEESPPKYWSTIPENYFNIHTGLLTLGPQMPSLSNRLGFFTESVIRKMTRIAGAHGAINLSQGFPDFDPPIVLMHALEKRHWEDLISMQ